MLLFDKLMAIQLRALSLVGFWHLHERGVRAQLYCSKDERESRDIAMHADV